MSIRYRNILCSKMTSEEIEASAKLFSENYGVWSGSAGEFLAGKRIRLSARRIREMFVDKPDRYVAMMYSDDKLIGQAFYLKRQSPWHKSRYITFVLQLVVDQKERGHRYGLSLLQSIFGISDDDAWGLFSSNPLTIRALEDATFRHVSPKLVGNKLKDGLREVLTDVFSTSDWLDSYREGCVDTKFPVDHSQNETKIKKAYPKGDFPFGETIRETEEWLAITFKSQEVDVQEESMKKLTETSWNIIQEAYSRMPVQNQTWASFADNEIDYLFDAGYIKRGMKVLDLGCGNGRHSVAMAKRGAIVHGVDFAQGLLNQALKSAEGLEGISFEHADVRSYHTKEKYDAILCVYDVIGSSIEDEDAKKVVNTISEALKRGGLAIVGVMNLELTKKRCSSAMNRFVNIRDKADFKKLMSLPASSTMQSTGDIFKGKLILLNPDTGVAYRRERFEPQDGEGLLVEYVIPDRRFSRDSLRKLFNGFVELSSRYVRAGHWDENLASDESHAKEVLSVFKKPRLGWFK